MAAPQIAPLPPFLTLGDGMRIVVTALDATTGATVGGVTVANVSIDVDTETDTEPEPAPSPVTGAYTSGSTA